jgi:hypothetical protein
MKILKIKLPMSEREKIKMKCMISCEFLINCVFMVGIFLLIITYNSNCASFPLFSWLFSFVMINVAKIIISAGQICILFNSRSMKLSKYLFISQVIEFILISLTRHALALWGMVISRT